LPLSLLFFRLSLPPLRQLMRPTRNVLLVACLPTHLRDEVPRVLTLPNITIPPKNLTTNITVTEVIMTTMATRLTRNVLLAAYSRILPSDEMSRELILLSIITPLENLPTDGMSRVLTLLSITTPLANLPTNEMPRVLTLLSTITPLENLPTNGMSRVLTLLSITTPLRNLTTNTTVTEGMTTNVMATMCDVMLRIRTLLNTTTRPANLTTVAVAMTTTNANQELFSAAIPFLIQPILSSKLFLV